MKYIRTKDGRIYQDADIFTCREMPLKVAGTIEELLNRYVIVSLHRNYSYKILTKIQFGNLNRKELLNKIKQGNTSVYGSIWTDKGLTYVAKMNEKGDLELL